MGILCRLQTKLRTALLWSFAQLPGPSQHMTVDLKAALLPRKAAMLYSAPPVKPQEGAARLTGLHCDVLLDSFCYVAPMDSLQSGAVVSLEWEGVVPRLL